MGSTNNNAADEQLIDSIKWFVKLDLPWQVHVQLLHECNQVLRHLIRSDDHFVDSQAYAPDAKKRPFHRVLDLIDEKYTELSGPRIQPSSIPVADIPDIRKMVPDIRKMAKGDKDSYIRVKNQSKATSAYELCTKLLECAHDLIRKDSEEIHLHVSPQLITKKDSEGNQMDLCDEDVKEVADLAFRTFEVTQELRTWRQLKECQEAYCEWLKKYSKKPEWKKTGNNLNADRIIAGTEVKECQKWWEDTNRCCKVYTDAVQEFMCLDDEKSENWLCFKVTDEARECHRDRRELYSHILPGLMLQMTQALLSMGQAGADADVTSPDPQQFFRECIKLAQQLESLQTRSKQEFGRAHLKRLLQTFAQAQLQLLNCKQ
jgi:hypothetical protein